MGTNARYTTMLLLALLSLSLSIGEEPVDLATIWKIKDEGLNRSHVMETLSFLTDVYGPRQTGSINMLKAQIWAKQKFDEWKLSNVHFESYNFGRGWVLDHVSAEMLQPSYSPLIAIPRSWTPGTPGAITAESVLAVINDDSDFEKFKGKLQGKFVLSQPEREVGLSTVAASRRYNEDDLKTLSQAPEPGARTIPRTQRPSSGFQRKLQDFYLAEGAAAVLEPGRGDGGTLFATTGGQRGPDSKPVACQLVLAVEHYNRIVRILEKGIPVQLRINVQSRFLAENLDAKNLLAEIPGDDRRNEIVMLGAHFDSHHAGTGATDNAAGSAAVLEAARILRSIESRPRRTIRFALWTGEEQGYLGSRAYVSEHFAARVDPPKTEQESSPLQARNGSRQSEAPALTERTVPAALALTPQYTNLSVYFNLDNGAGKIRGIYLQGNEQARPIFERWIEAFRDMGMTTISIRNTVGTDHVPFDAVGLPAFQFIQDPLEYSTRTHHSNMDVYDRVQRADLIQASIVLASFAWQAANRDQKLPRKPLPRNQVIVQHP
jgi:carboxypeptidase Q